MEELRKDKEIEAYDSDSNLDLHSDVLDQIDEFAIKIENLKLRLSKKKQKKTPSKDSRIKDKETNISTKEGKGKDSTKKIK